MIIDENDKQRRIRIIGKPGEVVGCAMEVRDFETGEAIDNAFRAEIVLDANEVNTVRLHYYESDKETGNPITGEDGNAVKRFIHLQGAEIDVTAFEECNEQYSVNWNIDVFEG